MSSEKKQGLKFDGCKLKTGIPEAGPMQFFYGSFTYGSFKYNENIRDRNYKKVPDPDIRYDEALERHRLRRNDGEIFDPESGLPHSSLLLFNAFCLLTLDMEKYKLTFNDLNYLMNKWKEIFNEPGFKLPDDRILSAIKIFESRIDEGCKE